jgi:asparagine synthase (glutamine-hydrolysing)
MYAIGLFDKLHKTLTLSRDRFGIKPLYWRYGMGGLLFASEVKALSKELQFGLNWEAVADLMTFGYYFEPVSVFKDVFTIAAGEVREFRAIDGQLKSNSRVAQWPPNISCSPSPTAVREAMTASVQAHLISDVPLATALSGGIDSSIVAAVAAELNPQVTAITNTWLGMRDVEVQYAERLTRALGLEHHAYHSAIDDGLKLLDSIAWHLEDPIPNVAAFHSYAIAEACRAAGLKAVLVGDGSDEVFGGYSWHRLAVDKELSRDPSLLFKAYEQRRSQRLAFEPLLSPEGQSLLQLRSDVQRDIFVNSIKSSNGSRLEAFVAFERQGQLQVSQLQRVDRMYMAHGVEARVPYLYDDVIAVASRLPDEARISDSLWRHLLHLRQDKVVLAKAFYQTVPRFALHRPKFGPKGTINLPDHLAPMLVLTFNVVLKSKEFLPARDYLSHIVNWATVEPARLSFKVNLLLTLITLCVGRFHLGQDPVIPNGGPSTKRIELFKHHRTLEVSRSALVVEA